MVFFCYRYIRTRISEFPPPPGRLIHYHYHHPIIRTTDISFYSILDIQIIVHLAGYCHPYIHPFYRWYNTIRSQAPPPRTHTRRMYKAFKREYVPSWLPSPSTRSNSIRGSIFLQRSTQHTNERNKNELIFYSTLNRLPVTTKMHIYRFYFALLFIRLPSKIK